MATITARQIAEALVAYDMLIPPGMAPGIRQRTEAMRAALEAAEYVRRDDVEIEAHGQPDGEPHVVGEAVVARGGVRCHARRCGDEMLCGRCGLTWSPDDQEPPACAPAERRVTVRREVDRG